MRHLKNIAAILSLSMLLYVCCVSCSNGSGNKTATGDNTKKAPWTDPRKGKIWAKVNVVQIPLTAYENHILGIVKSVSYVDYKLFDKQDSAKVLDDSGYNIYDKFGHLVNQNEYKADGTPKWHCIYTYDDKNKATEWLFHIYSDGMESRTTFKYDEKGNKTEENTVDTNKKYSGHTTYKYNDKGNETEVARYDGDGKLRSTEIYKYDDKGNQIGMTETAGDGKLIWKIECTYDKDGNRTGGANYRSDTGKPGISKETNDQWGRCIEGISYNPDGTIWSKNTMKYDNWGNTIEYLTYDKDGKLDEQRSTYSELDYDATGNIIKETDYKMKGGRKIPVSLAEVKYTYY